MQRADVVATFDDYNVLFFGGKLSRPKFRLQAMKNFYALFHWPCPQHPAGLLILSCTPAPKHFLGWRGTLLHEMIHIWLSEHDENDVHGAAFTRECNRIGRVLGLSDVDLDDAGRWPAHHLNREEAGEAGNILDDFG